MKTPILFAMLLIATFSTQPADRPSKKASTGIQKIQLNKNRRNELKKHIDDILGRTITFDDLIEKTKLLPQNNPELTYVVQYIKAKTKIPGTFIAFSFNTALSKDALGSKNPPLTIFNKIFDENPQNRDAVVASKHFTRLLQLAQADIIKKRENVISVDGIYKPASRSQQDDAGSRSSDSDSDNNSDDDSDSDDE